VKVQSSYSQNTAGCAGVAVMLDTSCRSGIQCWDISYGILQETIQSSEKTICTEWLNGF